MSSLNDGIAAHKAGDLATARRLLIAAVKEEPNSERAWGWLYNVANNDKEKLQCLKRILEINPSNKQAQTLIREYQKDEFPFAEVEAARPATPATAAGLDGISIILIVLLIILGLFWLGIGLLQIATDMAIVGMWNIAMSLINLAFIGNIVKRSKRVPGSLGLLALVGSLIGGYQLIANGAWLQACVVPLYIAIGILANVNKAAYTK